MTENKRFELRICSNGTYYLYDYGELTDIDFDKFNKESANELVDLLNELHKENIRLKRDFDSCSHNWALMYDEAKDIVNALHEENEQFKDALNQRTDQCDKYYKENEQLKQQLKELQE